MISPIRSAIDPDTPVSISSKMMVGSWLWCCLLYTSTDDSSFVTDVYWFRTATQTVDVDTSLRVPVEQPIYVYRLGGVEDAVDTLAFEVLPEYTTAVAPDNYQLVNSVVRFVTADTPVSYTHLVQGVIGRSVRT